jgi:hypothetical protein
MLRSSPFLLCVLRKVAVSQAHWYTKMLHCVVDYWHDSDHVHKPNYWYLSGS